MYTSRPATHVSDALQPPPLPHVITSRGSVIAVPAVVVCGMLGLLVDDLRAQKVLGRHHARGIARRLHATLHVSFETRGTDTRKSCDASM
eukprot:201882-Rhodomonas_salina.1